MPEEVYTRMLVTCISDVGVMLARDRSTVMKNQWRVGHVGGTPESSTDLRGPNPDNRENFLA